MQAIRGISPAIFSLFFLMSAGRSAFAAGCEKDTDCKGDRLCVKGECISEESAEAAERPKSGGPSISARCKADIECKGNHLCDRGACVDPQPAPPGYVQPQPAPPGYVQPPSTYPEYADPAAATPAVPANESGFKPFVVGAFASMGIAHMIHIIDGQKNNAIKPRFAGGGSVYFNFYFIEVLALDIGIGLIGKGGRTADPGYEYRCSVLYMEVPLGLKLNIKGFQAGLALALNFALMGREKEVEDGSTTKTTWSGDDWNGYRRFNIAPRILLGYAIPIGRIALVPSITVSGEILDNATDGMLQWYHVNFMFDVGVEFGFGK
jgi:hypothetical protein